MNISRHWGAIVLLSLCMGLAAADDATTEDLAVEDAAPGVIVREAHTELKDDVYYLQANIEYRFSQPALEAMQKGVPLTVVMRIEILQERNYLWSQKVAALEQRYQLSFHALSQQYMLRNLNSGSQYIFPSLDAARTVLGTIVDLPVIDGNLLEDGARYTGRLMAELDVDQLPTPLRLLALVSKDWQLNSEWYSWPL
ncbi:MAG: DUF4390 domain-containing protein [Gammaproteobacteria bacterium]|nr:DUF4390 domain-containing protein [Gammaproteobacteria bacterium]